LKMKFFEQVSFKRYLFFENVNIQA